VDGSLTILKATSDPPRASFHRKQNDILEKLRKEGRNLLSSGFAWVVEGIRLACGKSHRMADIFKVLVNTYGS
jgi:hypothetical protein